MSDNDLANKLIIHPSFKETIEDINKKNINIPKNSTNEKLDYYNYIYPPNGKLLTVIDDIKKINLNPKNGEKIAKSGRPLMAYDESINKFSSLEGSAYLTSHSLVLAGENDYIPSNKITLYFYTRSNDISKDTKYIKYSKDPDSDSKEDFVNDKIEFLKQNASEKTILLVDGPLIGGDWYIHMMDAIDEFLDKDIIPIFFVKNSNSNLVTDEIEELNNKFNSDMHWSYNYLNQGERTNFFRYADKKNKKNSKIFCYLKSFNVSPQRIEFHVDTYKKYRDQIPQLLDLVYYLILVQGDKKNPQARPIAIAEKYARSTINLFDLSKMMKNVGIIPTMNQERFAW